MSDDDEQTANHGDAEAGPRGKPVEMKETTKKIIRVLTVLAYLSSVSMAAIMLSLYYIFLWNPASVPQHSARTSEAPGAVPDGDVTPKS